MLRSLLFVPADSERKLAKAASAGADALILDLEDSVAESRKAAARGLAGEYLSSRERPAAVWVRVNDPHSGEMQEDLAALIRHRPYGIILPKIRGPEDIQTLARVLTDLEGQTGAPRGQTKILALATETPSALLRMSELLRDTSPRLTALGWGAEDLSAALGAGDPRLPNGAWRPLYERAREQCLLAAHAMGIDAIDTVHVDFRDLEGLRHACGESRYDGFTGRFAIHPDQVRVINDSFTPSEAELATARRIVDAFAQGEGVISLDGKMYDIPHLKAARRLLSKAAGAARES